MPSVERAPERLRDRPKVVIVDDDHDFRDLVELYLKSEGYEVVLQAQNPEEALVEVPPRVKALQAGGTRIKIILDGDLGTHRGYHDGKEAADLYRKLIPGAEIIESNNQGGISDPPVYGDYRLFKCDDQFFPKLFERLAAPAAKTTHNYAA